MTMTLEQFEKFVKNLPEDVDRNKVAKALNVKLPVVIPPLDEQLSAVEVKAYTPKATKRNPNPQEATYVAVPSLKLDENSGTKSLWINTRVARQVAQKILDVLDEQES